MAIDDNKIVPDDPEITPVASDDVPEDYTEETVVKATRRPKKVYAGMWGPLELVAVGLSAFLLLISLLWYLGFVVPESRSLASDRAKRDQLEKDLADKKKKFGDITNTKTQVAKLVASAETFESRQLQEESIGRTAIYQRLNGLIDAFGLVNSSGPDYTPIDVSEEERQQGTNERTQRGRSRFQSLYPGIYVTMTVEGSYVNVRRFLNEIENSSEFIVISTIQLEPAEGSNAPGETPTAQPGRTEAASKPVSTRETGRTRGNVVSLRLELAAYFQRTNEQKMLTSSADMSADAEPGTAQ